MKSLFSRLAATISELKTNPNEVLNQANGEPIVIMSHNKPWAYMVPVETFEQMQALLEDYRLLQEACKRMDEESVPVTINELRAATQEKSAQGVEQTYPFGSGRALENPGKAPGKPKSSQKQSSR